MDKGSLEEALLDKIKLAVDAIKNGDVEKLKQLLSAEPDLENLLSAMVSHSRPTNHAFGHDTTLLQFASFRRWKDTDTASILIDRGAKVDIHSACGLGRVADIEQLLADDPKAFEEQIDTYFPIQYAIAAGVADSIEALMLGGDDPNRDLKKVAYFGWEDDIVGSQYTLWKPIHMASLWGFNAERLPVAKALAKHGADLNAVSPLDGFRPLHLVAMSNRVDMMRYLLESSVDVDSRSSQCQTIDAGEGNEGPVSGWSLTPLMVACGEGFMEATQCLLEHGADVNAQNDEGKTALHFAAKRAWDGQPYDGIIRLLNDHGADRTIADNEGNVAAIDPQN